MQKKDRQPYIELTSQVDWQLCSFCKFNQCMSYGDSPCDCGEPDCCHPLGYRLEHDSEPGEDCWGFRPDHDISFCADIVGIILSKGWQGATWWQNKKGDWKVAEVVY